MSRTEDPEKEKIALYAAAADASLVIASLLGDLAAFDTLARRYRRAVQFVAGQIVGVGSDVVAEDIAQDVFVAAFQALPSLSEPAKFAGWLYAITRNRARRVQARERRTQPTEDAALQRLTDADLHQARAADPAKRWERHLQQTEIWDALEQLSQEHREVLYLHHCEEWPLSRIAGFLSVPETTVKGRLHRAREALRCLLTPPSHSSKPQNPKGNKNHEPTQRSRSRDPAYSPHAETDAPPGRALQPDRRSVRGGDRCGSAVQPDPEPARRAWRAVADTVPTASAGRLL